LEQAYKQSCTGNDDDDRRLKQDDDTASTLSTTTSSDDDDLEPQLQKGVTFCEPLVTSVYTRPFTTKEDKYYLHYSEHDYIDFKVEFLTGRIRRRRVSFARELVAEVHPVPVATDKQALYYSETELQE
jgi:hypothetical protein